MIKALLFDFDGLILETESPIYQSWFEVYESYKQELPMDGWASILGTNESLFDPHLYLEEKLGVNLNRQEIESQRRQREHDLIMLQPVMPGVVAYLEGARSLGLKTAVASSSSRDWVAGHITRLGLLEYFDCIRTREDVHLTKPDPALYLSAMEALGVQPDQAIVFEDSPNGILAAKRAGIFAVAVPNELTRNLPLDKADLRLNSLAELPLEELLRKVER